MSGSSVLRAVVLAGLAGGVGCSLFVDLKGLSAGGADDVVEASLPDDGGHVSASDGDVLADAPVNDVVVEAGAPFCKSKSGYLLCEDFDDNALPGAFDIIADTFARLDSAFSVSPSNALLFDIPAQRPPEQYGLRWTIKPASPTGYDFSFDVRIDSDAIDDLYIQLLNFFSSNGSEVVEVGLTMRPGRVFGTHVFSNDDPSWTKGLSSSKTLDAGVWHRVGLRVSVPGGVDGDYEYFLDGERLGGAKTGSPANPNSFTVVVGPYCENIPAFQARYDNVLMLAR